MNIAMTKVESELVTYNSMRSKAELLTGLIQAWDEFSAAVRRRRTSRTQPDGWRKRALQTSCTTWR